MAGEDANAFLTVPFTGTTLCLFLFVFAGYLLDRRRHVKFRRGQKLQGPDMRSRWSFNRTIKATGSASCSTTGVIPSSFCVDGRAK